LCHDLALHGQVPIFVNAKDFVPVLVSDDQFHMIHLPLVYRQSLAGVASLSSNPRLTLVFLGI